MTRLSFWGECGRGRSTLRKEQETFLLFMLPLTLEVQERSISSLWADAKRLEEKGWQPLGPSSGSVPQLSHPHLEEVFDHSGSQSIYQGQPELSWLPPQGGHQDKWPS